MPPTPTLPAAPPADTPPACLPQARLPHTSALFVDAIEHPERTAPFYAWPERNLESFRKAAAAVALPDERRAALVAALAGQNPPSATLDRLARPGTVAVVTGQQVGLFSGPAYTLYKALHAARLAAWLTENGIPAVPVFWLATEDHDFAEVNHAWVFGAAHRPVKLEMPGSVGARPVGGIPLEGAPVGELRRALQDLPFGDAVADMAARCYRPDSTLGEAFRDLLREITAPFDILQIDPMQPGFRELAAPAMRAAVEASDDLSRMVLERNRELAGAGYHAQVHVDPQTSFFFLLEDGKRLALRRDGAEYTLGGRRFSQAELAARAQSLSPNALLRPVVQDSVLPTAALILGPAELAYLAQSEPLYRTLLGRMPVAVPRAGFTLLDARSHKLMERYGLTLPDFFHGEQALRERIAARLAPPAVAAALRRVSGTVEHAVAELRGELAGFDPTLARALDTSARKIRHQIARIEGKAGREALRRDVRASADAASLYGLVYPERHLQERLYSALPFLAAHGLDLPARLYEAIQPGSTDHRILAI